MKQTKVRDLMVPLSDYATVSEQATLYEAVMALEQAQIKFDKNCQLIKACNLDGGDQGKEGKVK